MIEFLPGISAMENIHPLFVHFPIAFLTAFFAIELLSALIGLERIRKVASWFLYFGTLGAIAAVSAGFRAAATVPHALEVHSIMENHKHLGLAVLSLALLLSFWRLFAGKSLSSITLRVVYLFLAFVMVAAMTVGADLGGLMVYKHGVGVRAVVVEPGHSHTGNEGEAGPGADFSHEQNVHDHGGPVHHDPAEGGGH